MEEQTDNTFIKNVSIVLAILVAFTIAIVFVARDIGFKDEEGNNPSRNTTTEERISPVAGVHTGEAGAAAIAEAASASASEPVCLHNRSHSARPLRCLDRNPHPSARTRSCSTVPRGWPG